MYVCARLENQGKPLLLAGTSRTKRRYHERTASLIFPRMVERNPFSRCQRFDRTSRPAITQIYPARDASILSDEVKPLETPIDHRVGFA